MINVRYLLQTANLREKTLFQCLKLYLPWDFMCKHAEDMRLPVPIGMLFCEQHCISMFTFISSCLPVTLCLSYCNTRRTDRSARALRLTGARRCSAHCTCGSQCSRRCRALHATTSCSYLGAAISSGEHKTHWAVAH